jgi:hypothetical protein
VLSGLRPREAIFLKLEISECPKRQAEGNKGHGRQPKAKDGKRHTDRDKASQRAGSSPTTDRTKTRRKNNQVVGKKKTRIHDLPGERDSPQRDEDSLTLKIVEGKIGVSNADAPHSVAPHETAGRNKSLSNGGKYYAPQSISTSFKFIFETQTKRQSLQS